MSTLWTPDGEYHVKQDTSSEQNAPSQEMFSNISDQDTTNEEVDAAAMAAQIRDADPAVIIANHCYGLFELAAIHLSNQPPNLASASLAIDALSAIVEEVGDRLGEYTEQFSDGLAQLRLAFVQLSSLPTVPPE